MLQKLVTNKESKNKESEGREKERKLEKGASILGTISGAGSVLGSWQICHAVCLGIVALLAAMGITLIGMPLGFLTTIAQPLWFIAVLFLVITGILYLTRRCISGRMLLVQSGLLVAGIPFGRGYAVLWWSVGGVLAIAGITAMIYKQLQRRKFHEKNKAEKCDKCH